MGVARVFTVPPGEPFLGSLARAILAGGFPAPDAPPPDPLALARWSVLLPTRRAARSLASAFLSEGGGDARLLPRIRAIGDPDEEELLWAAEEGDAGLDLPPAIPPMKRLFLLAGLIREWAAERPRGRLSQALTASPAQALALARSLASLIDSCETEELSLSSLDTLLGDELAGHQAAALDFLDILRVRLPALIAAEGFIGPVERRNLLLKEEGRRLGSLGAPVIAAGSTGSIPATAELLSTIARLGHGAVVLPGLDLALEEESWTALDPQHPQYGMAELLKRMGVSRGEVRLLPGTVPPPVCSRAWLASEIMRPTGTTHRWHEAFHGRGAEVEAALRGVEVLEAADEREEAAAIALMMRRTLESRDETCALITPDRALARRVKAELGRWGVAVDDSAGEPLIRMPAGAFMGLIARAAADRFAATSLMPLLDHPFCRVGASRETLLRGARALELALYRNRAPSPPPDRLSEALAAARAGREDAFTHPAVRRLKDYEWEAAERLCVKLLDAFAPLLALQERARVPLADLLVAHVGTAEALAVGPGPSPLWRGEEGRVLSSLMASLMGEAPRFAALGSAEYPALVESFLALAAVRPRRGAHPRLAILGLLEARMADADLTILGGLNEGVWPGIAETGPWLNRPQLQKLGLPLPERRIGLAAHDFAQAFGRPRAVLALSRKIGASPAVPSRWIMRLKALRLAAGVPDDATAGAPWDAWVKALDHPQTVRPAVRPAPRPPADLRPKVMSVTRIEELMRDPYAAFARHVLGLRPLGRLGEVAGAMERGNIVHRMVQEFTRRHPGPLPEGAEALIMEEAEKALAEFGIDGAQAAFWRPQLLRIARWFLDHETIARRDVAAHFVEIDGESELVVGDGVFRLTARADRIDRLLDGTLRILDYKTGALPSFNATKAGFSPQLLLEAHMARLGGFPEVGRADASAVAYMRLSGGTPAGEHKAPKNVAALVDEAADGLLTLLSAYADAAMPYEARDWSDQPQARTDYGHLSRWREWSLGGGEDAP